MYIYNACVNICMFVYTCMHVSAQVCGYQSLAWVTNQSLSSSSSSSLLILKSLTESGVHWLRLAGQLRIHSFLSASPVLRLQVCTAIPQIFKYILGIWPPFLIFSRQEFYQESCSPVLIGKIEMVLNVTEVSLRVNGARFLKESWIFPSQTLNWYVNCYWAWSESTEDAVGWKLLWLTGKTQGTSLCAQMLPSIAVHSGDAAGF